MSLFPSSFEGSSKAGPSTSLTSAFSSKSGKSNANNNGNNKRKRASLGGGGQPQGAHHDANLLKSTQANLEKLMNKLEKGDFKEKVGTENMGEGLSSKKKKKIDNHPNPNNRKQSIGNNNNQKASNKVETPKGKGKESAAAAASTPNSNKKSKTLDKSQAQPKLKKNNSATVELPIPSPSNKLKVGGEGLTDMQSKMQSKLEGARFRWINEQLYTTPSTEAVEMMKRDPKIFADYHMTHRVLTSGWPSPPLDYIIKSLSTLPDKTVIVDLGCGDAGLAKALVPTGKIVLSFDLVGDSGVPGSILTDIQQEEDSNKISEGWVVQADFLEKVPLPGRPGGINDKSNQTTSTTEATHKKNKKKNKSNSNGSSNSTTSEIVDVVVCCLSLMGKNWVGGIYEACRILKQGGTFHVAEVSSRFESTEESFIEKIESFGFKLQEKQSPSTHFTLFEFTKESQVPLSPVKGEKGWKERVKEGEDILKACVYKKR